MKSDNENMITFHTHNLGIKNNNHIDDIIDNIIIYRVSEVNKNLFKNAEIQTYAEKKYKKKIDYKKDKDILIIRNLKIPIYLINYIYLQ